VLAPEKTNAGTGRPQTGARGNPEAEPTDPRSTDPLSARSTRVAPFPGHPPCVHGIETAEGDDTQRSQASNGPADRAAKTLRPIDW
jgi:hypothetical protein